MSAYGSVTSINELTRRKARGNSSTRHLPLSWESLNASPQDENEKSSDQSLCQRIFPMHWSRETWITTACLFWEMFVWGLFIGTLNTALLDLEMVTNTTTSQVALLFTVMTIGSCLGAPLGGVLLDRLDCHVYQGMSLLGFGLMVIILPHSTSFIKMLIVSAILGFSLGIEDVGRNITALNIWGWDGSSVMQAFHFDFAIATAITPWLVKPFLANIEHIWHCNHNVTVTEPTASWNTTVNETCTEEIVMGETNIVLAFGIVGSLMWLTAILYFLVYFFVSRKQGGKYSCRQSDNEESVEGKWEPMWYRVTMAIFVALRFSAIVAIEVTYSGLLMTFAVKGLGWSKADALISMFVFRIAFAVNRGVSIPLALWLSPTKIMIINISLLCIAFITLLSANTSNPIILNITSALVGAGSGSLYASSMTWTHAYLTVTGFVGSSFVMGAYGGVMIVPALTGYLFDNVTEFSFIYVNCFVCVLLVIITSITIFLGRIYKKNQPPLSNDKVMYSPGIRHVSPADEPLDI